jgi:hypothetical protein
MLQPHWAMGFHQSHGGYYTLSVVKEIEIEYQVNTISIDVQWGYFFIFYL